jgi:hypothetical protein
VPLLLVSLPSKSLHVQSHVQANLAVLKDRLQQVLHAYRDQSHGQRLRHVDLSMAGGGAMNVAWPAVVLNGFPKDTLVDMERADGSEGK